MPLFRPRRLIVSPKPSATAAACDDDTEVPYPACHLHRRDWDVPVRTAPDGPARLELTLAPGQAL